MNNQFLLKFVVSYKSITLKDEVVIKRIIDLVQMIIIQMNGMSIGHMTCQILNDLEREIIKNLINDEDEIFEI